MYTLYYKLLSREGQCRHWNLSSMGVLWGEVGPCSRHRRPHSLGFLCLLTMLSVESGVEKVCLVFSVKQGSKSHPHPK